MPFELREGQGTLHRVLDKKGNDKAPDYHGELNLNGTMYKLAGWIKITPRGGKWLSLTCEVPRAKAALEKPVLTTPAKPQPAIDLDSDIPF